jgi:hypothetical protein
MCASMPSSGQSCPSTAGSPSAHRGDRRRQGTGSLVRRLTPLHTGGWCRHRSGESPMTDGVSAPGVRFLITKRTRVGPADPSKACRHRRSPTSDRSLRQHPTLPLQDRLHRARLVTLSDGCGACVAASGSASSMVRMVPEDRMAGWDPGPRAGTTSGRPGRGEESTHTSGPVPAALHSFWTPR